METLLLFAGIGILALIVMTGILLRRAPDGLIAGLVEHFDDGQARLDRAFRDEIDRVRRGVTDESRGLREEVHVSLKQLSDSNLSAVSAVDDGHRIVLDGFSERLATLTATIQDDSLRFRDDV